MTTAVGDLTTPAERPDSEQARLEALDWYDLRPGPTEETFEGITRVAALVLDAPMAFVSVVGRDRIWFKAAVGAGADPVARAGSFCTATVDAGAMMVVADASADPRFAASPMVTGQPRIRFYAGVPLRTPEGHCVGALCVFDTRSRLIDEAQQKALQVLGEQVCSQIASRRTSVEMRHQKALLELAGIDLSERESAVRCILETAAQVLGVERAGLWFFDEERSAIVAESLFVAPQRRHESGARLEVSAFPRYFAALGDSREIAAHEARSDPRTSEFAATYFLPLDICSLLDVPVRREGRVVGVLCNEQVGRVRQWSPEDQEFARSVADLVGTMIEASRRRRTEEELRLLTATLEQRVAERTSDLETTNTALVEAVSDLEAFCYSVSHDLRSPLRVINGFASMLHDSEKVVADPDTRRVIARIRENTNRMSDLLDDLLSFFRLGRRVIEVTRIDMNELVRETVAALELDTMRTEFRCGELEPVEGDRALLADVVANLVINAFKFSARRPSPRVEVGCEGGVEEVVYFVRDNGVGFQTDHAARLFEPFQRLHAADGYEGTGVGLAIVRRILERHGGRVWAESIPTRGSTFRFALPR